MVQGWKFAHKNRRFNYNVTTPGSYYVVVTNSVATELTRYSDTVTHNPTHNAVALKLREKRPSIIVYPNPASTTATLSFKANEKYSVTITDMTGKAGLNTSGISPAKSNAL